MDDGTRVNQHAFSTSIPDYVLDMGLSPHAIRLYVHLMRLYQEGLRFEATRELAAHCRMSLGGVVNAREELTAAGLLQSTPGLKSENAVAMIKSKSPQTISLLGYIKVTCSWCKCTTLCLEDHHYPISRKEGGKETVAICANCHSEFHHLTEPTYELTPLARGEE